MIELTGLGSVLRGLGIIYWALAIGLLSLAIWKGKGWMGKALWSGVVLLVFGYFPVKGAMEQAKKDAYAREAWAYFKKKCDTEAGEKIYRTFTDVRSVLVIKALPLATDENHFDQFWYGDPYSRPGTNKRAEDAARLLTLNSRRSGTRQNGLDFVELKEFSSGEFIRIHRPKSNDEKSIKEVIKKPISQFGVSWQDISTPEDRKYWVAGSRLAIIDLRDNTVVAERIGFLIEPGFGSQAGGRRPWLVARRPGTSCPPLRGGDYSDNWFITSVLRQNKGQ